MRPTLFNDLTLAQKELLIDDLGQHLLSIEHYDLRIHLYSFGNMFVEMSYNVETKGLENILSISYSDLDKYLSRILIHRLLDSPPSSNKPFYFL